MTRDDNCVRYSFLYEENYFNIHTPVHKVADETKNRKRKILSFLSNGNTHLAHTHTYPKIYIFSDIRLSVFFIFDSGVWGYIIMKWKRKKEERDITLVMSVLLKMITQESSHSLSLSFYTICLLFHSTSLHVHTTVQCSESWYYERNMKSTLLRLLYLVSELCIRNLQSLFGTQSTSVWVNSISPVLVHVLRKVRWL